MGGFLYGKSCFLSECDCSDFSYAASRIFFPKDRTFDDAFVSRMNKFVFVVPLPVLLFQDIARIDIYEAWDFRMVAFCFSITSVSIIISVFLSRFLHPSDIRGELSRHLTGAVLRSWVSPLSRTFMETPEWLR